ncbi:hypothetical protein AVEN_264832-1 [Araneus ventricosus]|uniref:Uncharacterized protein n=1 Tax=Araneus ventricosus TaxID=182803 RepID=A0A4Y2DZB4_ARAVE|nr:hypothetical protein AVEN_264832-1 [Araneus ventricosus]
MKSFVSADALRLLFGWLQPGIDIPTFSHRRAGIWDWDFQFLAFSSCQFRMVISEFIPTIAGMCFDPGESHQPLSQIKKILNFVYCRRPRRGAPQSHNGRLTVSMGIDPDPVFQSPPHLKINCSQISLKNGIILI